jgi:regulator of protease activity HflC (stomatin/prohibitin superfamily)
MEYVTYVALAILFAVTLHRAIYIVPQGEQFTLESFGQFQHVMKPGIHFLIPFYHRVAHKVNMMEQVIEIEPINAISADNASVTVDAIAYVQVIDAEKSSYEVNDVYYAIATLVNTTLRSELGKMELDKILSSRAEINGQLMDIMTEAAKPWGIKVTRIELRDVQPPKDLMDAMSAQMKAERVKRAQILEAEGERQANVTKAEGNKQSWILQAEGTKQAQVLKAEGEKDAAKLQAEAREALANAEAKATAIVSSAIKEGDPKALEYFLGQSYIQAFEKLANSPNKTFVMLPTEMTGLSGLVSGLQQFVKKN